VRQFPITRGHHGPGELRRSGQAFAVVGVPWDMLAPHEAGAVANHGQTLTRLAERGGLDAGEALALLEGKRWRDISDNWAENNRRLAVLIFRWMSTHAAGALVAGPP
jgi:hypothetical protein